MPETKVTIILGTQGYAGTKQQIDDLNRALKGLGMTTRDIASNRSGTPGNIARSMGLSPFDPTSTPPSGTGSGSPNWGMAAMGGVSGMFSPWIGARLINQSGILGKAGGVGGGLLGGGVMGFAEAYIGLQVVMKTLRYSFDQLNKAVEHGYQIYTRAAQAGVSTSYFSKRQILGDVAGLSESQVESMMTRSGWGKSGGSLASFKINSELSGMARVLAEVEPRIEKFNDVLASTAGSLSMVAVDTKVAKVGISAVWAELAAGLSGPWDDFLRTLTELLEIFERSGMLKDSLYLTIAALGSLAEIMKVLALAAEVQYAAFALLTGKFSEAEKIMDVIYNQFSRNPFSSPQSPDLAGNAQARMLPVSHWERMGLVLGNVSSRATDYARQTAANTLSIATLLKQLQADANSHPILSAGYPAP